MARSYSGRSDGGNMVRFAKGTRFMYNSDNVSSAPCRMREYTDKTSGKKYFEGAIQLSNGQWLWISTGGRLNVTEKNGRKYITCKAKLTGGSATSDRYYN